MPKKLIDALSDVGVRGAKPTMRDGVPVDRKLHDGRGLYLLVRANGARHWHLKFYLAGRERLLALGEYPDVTLARALGGVPAQPERCRLAGPQVHQLCM